MEFKRIADDYFQPAFGPDGGLCRAYLARLSYFFDPAYLQGEKSAVDEGAVDSLEKVGDVVRSFRPVIDEHAHLEDRCWAASWRYLIFHGDLCVLLAQTLAARARGKRDEMDRCRGLSRGWCGSARTRSRESSTPGFSYIRWKDWFPNAHAATHSSGTWAMR